MSLTCGVGIKEKYRSKTVIINKREEKEIH